MVSRAEAREGRGGPPSPLVRIGDFFRALTRSVEPCGTETERNERAEVALIRGVRKEDLLPILRWISHPEVRGHLDPVPELPRNWDDQTQVEEAIEKLGTYYENFGERQKIMPMIAVNRSGQPIAVGTIRWRGDPYVPRDKKIASIERVIVDPELHGRGTGTRLLATMIEYAFDYYRGYRGGGTKEIRAWVMADKEAAHWERNVSFLQRLGFRILSSAPQWEVYAVKRGIPTAGRKAIWFYLRQEGYKASKKENSYIKPCESLDISVLR